MSAEEPILPFATAEAWETWLEEHHQTTRGVRVKIAKKGTGIDSVRYPEVLDVAIAFGWIDAVRHAHDETYFLQRFTPRGPRSRWSKINVAKATALIEAGTMRPAGLAEVERAKADGRWAAAYAGSATIEVPDDLRAALDAEPAAAAAFETLSSQNRYAILYRTHDAKRPETRARRIATFVAMLAAGETPHPQ